VSCKEEEYCLPVPVPVPKKRKLKRPGMFLGRPFFYTQYVYALSQEARAAPDDMIAIRSDHSVHRLSYIMPCARSVACLLYGVMRLTP
jgi:hypothetical protein